MQTINCPKRAVFICSSMAKAFEESLIVVRQLLLGEFVDFVNFIFLIFRWVYRLILLTVYAWVFYTIATNYTFSFQYLTNSFIGVTFYGLNILAYLSYFRHFLLFSPNHWKILCLLDIVFVFLGGFSWFNLIFMFPLINATFYIGFMNKDHEIDCLIYRGNPIEAAQR